MKNKMFITLFKMRDSSTKRDPLEDFTTEILAGILNSNKELLNDFVNSILKIDGHGFTVSTQKKYDDVSPNAGSHSLIDIVIENKNSLCFIEMKVHSSENKEKNSNAQMQLSTYDNILFKQKKTAYLRYCTKRRDIKKKDSFQVKFDQFRWQDIYLFLNNEKYLSNEIIKPFLCYLKDKHMNNIPPLNNSDINKLSELSDTLQTLFKNIKDIEPVLSEMISTKSKILYSDILKKNRLAIRVRPILGNEDNEDRSALVFSFDMSEIPTITSYVWCHKSNSQFNNFSEEVKKYKDNNSEFDPEIEENENNIFVRFQLPLTYFVSDTPNHETASDWLVTKILLWSNFISYSNKTKWNNNVINRQN